MAAMDAPLRRSRSNRMVAGVIGGLAEHFDIDPTLARALFVIGSVLSAAFPGMLIYLILWLVMPQEPGF